MLGCVLLDTLKFPLVLDFLNKTWFCGFVSTEEAEKMLFRLPAGTFLVRFADPGRFAFYVSYVAVDDKFKDSFIVKHASVMKVPAGYLLDLSPVLATTASGSSGAAGNVSDQRQRGKDDSPLASSMASSSSSSNSIKPAKAPREKSVSTPARPSCTLFRNSLSAFLSLNLPFGS